MKNFIYILLIGLPLCLCSCVETEVDDKALLEQVEALFKANKYAEALSTAKRLVRVCEEKYGAEHADTVVAKDKLGWAYFETKDYTKAESIFKPNLETCKKVLGLEHQQTAECLDSMSLLYYNTGDWDKAVRFAQQTLDLKEKIYGPDHQKTAYARVGLRMAQREASKARQQQN